MSQKLCLDAGCKRCGHDGHRKGKIQAHSGRNACSDCSADEEGRCQARQFDQCGCAFHRLDKQRKVVRVSLPVLPSCSGTVSAALAICAAAFVLVPVCQERKLACQVQTYKDAADS